MWNENACLELLKSMPEQLSGEDLARLQEALDADKYVSSVVNGRDMCGEFAPFCKGCTKEGLTPCAVAYINMKNGEGGNYTIASEKDKPEDNSLSGQETDGDGEETVGTSAEDAAMAELTQSQDVLRLDKPQEVLRIDKPDEVLRIDKPEEVPRIDKPEEVLRIEGESSVQQVEEKPESKKIRIAIARRKRPQ